MLSIGGLTLSFICNTLLLTGLLLALSWLSSCSAERLFRLTLAPAERPAVGFVLLLAVLMIVFCLTRGANPVPGYTPPHDSEYYAQHLDELAQELNENVLPMLDETAHAEAGDETVTVTASEKEYVPVRGAVLKFYDAALFTFEKANQN